MSKKNLFIVGAVIVGLGIGAIIGLQTISNTERIKAQEGLIDDITSTLPLTAEQKVAFKNAPQELKDEIIALNEKLQEVSKQEREIGCYGKAIELYPQLKSNPEMADEMAFCGESVKKVQEASDELGKAIEKLNASPKGELELNASPNEGEAFIEGSVGTKGVLIYSNGGNYWGQWGTPEYWHYVGDSNNPKGYCCQYGGWCTPCYFQWTWNTGYGGDPDNGGNWHDANTPDTYQIPYAFLPKYYSGWYNATAGAIYEIWYKPDGQNISYTTRTVDQNVYGDGDVWKRIGASTFRKIEQITLEDMTTESQTASRQVVWDELKLED